MLKANRPLILMVAGSTSRIVWSVEQLKVGVPVMFEDKPIGVITGNHVDPVTGPLEPAINFIPVESKV